MKKNQNCFAGLSKNTDEKETEWKKNCKNAIRKFFALHANSKNTPFIYDIVLHCSHFTILELTYHFKMTIKMQWRIYQI